MAALRHRGTASLNSDETKTQPSMSQPASSRGNGARADTLLQTTVVVSTLLSLVYLSHYGLIWVPKPLPATAPAAVFSEGRATYHAAHLSETIGNRMVGTPNVERAAQYVLDEVLKIVALASQHPQLIAEADREQTSGGLLADFAGVRVASAYKNLTNIVLHLRPIDVQLSAGRRNALLLNSHFDSIFGTKGASDCGACVGVMLEIARVLVSDHSISLRAPVTFLFNGGEETLLLAAHGFMQQSKWASDIGAFINLESTGPGGPGFLFQHTAGWTVEAYAKAAKYPHGSVCGQDFFDSRILKMDTDFRMFSAQHHGSLPGIDIAYIMDGAAYHTYQDTVHRMRAGTVQASGENILAAALHFTHILSRNSEAPSLQTNDVFYDILGRYMITYSWEVGRVLHVAPLLVVACLTAFLRPSSLRHILVGFALVSASLLSAVFVTAAFAALHVIAAGVSMLWFGKPLFLGILFGPTAFAGQLLPYAARVHQPPRLRSCLLGFSYFHAFVAVALTLVNAKSGFMSAIWSITGTIAAVATPLNQAFLDIRSLLALLAISIPASIVTMPFLTCLPIFIMEHISISGGQAARGGHLVGDVVISAIIGLALFVTGAYYAILIAHIARRRLRVGVLLLLGASVCCAVYGSFFKNPYSATHPKRVLLQHLHQLDASGRVTESRWSVAGLDPVPITAVLPSTASYRNGQPGEWQGLFPLSSLLHGVSIPAEGPDSSFSKGRRPPVSMEVTRREALSQHGDTWERIYVELHAAKPPWGTLNVTGRLRNWSFTDALVEGQQYNVVRFASNDNFWPFWLDVEKGSVVNVRAAILFLDNTAAIDGFIANLPSWSNPMPMTGFQADFRFP